MEAFIIIIVALVAVGVFASVASKGNSSAVFRQAADRLGLHFKAGDILANPEILGTLQASRVSVVGQREDTSITAVHYRVGYPHQLGLTFKITRRSTYTGQFSLTGAPPIETGDEGFDRSVLVKGEDADVIRALLTAARRHRIARLLSVLPGAVIEHSQITWRQREVPKHPDQIIAPVERMVRLARDLSEYHIQQLDSIPLAAAPPVSLPLGGVVEDSPQDDTPLSRFESRPAFERMEPKEAERRDESPAHVTAKSVSDTPPAAEQLASGTLTVDAVCSTLFDTALSASDAARQFDSLFKHKDVAWCGILTSLATYPFDRVFGRERGAKATVSICEAQERLGARAVQAVIQLPPDDVADLRTLVGRKVDFRGTLLQCDHFMHSLFVNNGRLRAAADDQT